MRQASKVPHNRPIDNRLPLQCPFPASLRHLLGICLKRWEYGTINGEMRLCGPKISPLEKVRLPPCLAGCDRRPSCAVAFGKRSHVATHLGTLAQSSLIRSWIFTEGQGASDRIFTVLRYLFIGVRRVKCFSLTSREINCTPVQLTLVNSYQMVLHNRKERIFKICQWSSIFFLFLTSFA